MMILFLLVSSVCVKAFFFFYHNCFKILVRQFSALASTDFPFSFSCSLPGLLMNEF